MYLSNTVSKFSWVSIVIFPLICALSAGCTSRHVAPCKSFIELPLEQQQARFKTCPLEQQLELYHCAMRQSPPIMGYEYEIAGHGEKIVPILIEKLRIEKEDDSKLELIRILQVMSKRTDVHNKQDMIEQVGRSVSSIRFYQMRQKAQDMFEDIKKNSAG